MRLSVSGAVGSTARESVGVLYVGLHTVGIQLVTGFHGINHIEVLSGVGNAVSGRIAHLVFDGILFDMFPFQGDSRLHVVLLYLVAQHQLGAHHTGCEVVAGMLEIGSHAQVFRCFGLVEPVLSLNVVFLLFLGVEGTSQERETGVPGDVPGDAEGSEIGEEAVFLMSVEEYSETLHVLHRSERSFAVGRFEVVMIVRDISYEVYLPSLVGLIAQIGLIVKIIRLVFSLCLQRTEEVGGGLVSHAVEP